MFHELVSLYLYITDVGLFLQILNFIFVESFDIKGMVQVDSDLLGYYSGSVSLLLARPIAIRVRIRLTGLGHVVITTL